MNEELLIKYEGLIVDIHALIGKKEFFVRVGQTLHKQNLQVIDISRNDNWLKIKGIIRYEVLVSDENNETFIWKVFEDIPVVVTYGKPDQAELDERKELIGEI
tara:strand:+ start:2039 stop:2347 length:309 start_codon:yes stop_codon:yes gene_type:complete